MNDEIELKPCLFCGSMNIGFRKYLDDMRAECHMCGASIAYMSSKKDASELWNERANA